MPRLKRDAPEDQTPTGPSASLETNTGKGMSGIQEFRRLKRLFPNKETTELWAMVGYGPQERALDAANAPWADGRASPREARYWRDPRPG